MSLLISAALLLLGLMFFCCAFVPASKCRTMGQGGLPAVLITSGKPHRREGTTPITFHLKLTYTPTTLFVGVFQVCCLVTSYLAVGAPPIGDDLMFGLSYYLLLASLVPTWLLGIGTIITACRQA